MLIGATQPAHALDERSDGHRGATPALLEALRDPAGNDAYEHATLRVAARSLPAVLATLNPRQLAIIRGRWVRR